MPQKKYRFELINAEEITDRYGADFCTQVEKSLTEFARHDYYDYGKIKGKIKDPILQIPNIIDEDITIEVKITGVWYSVIRVKYIGSLN